MLRNTSSHCLAVPLVLTLIFATAASTRAETTSPSHRTPIRESIERHTAPGSPLLLKPIPRKRAGCNLKRRALIGAAVGAVSAVVLIHKAVAELDGAMGVSDNLHVAGLGGAMGAFLGVRSCWSR